MKTPGSYLQSRERPWKVSLKLEKTYIHKQSVLHWVPVGGNSLWTLCWERKGVFQGRRPVAVKLLITIRADQYLQKSSSVAFEVINASARSLVTLERARGCPHFSPWFPLMRVFPVQAQAVDPVSSLLIPSLLLSLPAALSHQYRSAQAAARLSCSPLLPFGGCRKEPTLQHCFTCSRPDHLQDICVLIVR